MVEKNLEVCGCFFFFGGNNIFVYVIKFLQRFLLHNYIKFKSLKGQEKIFIKGHKVTFFLVVHESQLSTSAWRNGTVSSLVLRHRAMWIYCKCLE